MARGDSSVHAFLHGKNLRLSDVEAPAQDLRETLEGARSRHVRSILLDLPQPQIRSIFTYRRGPPKNISEDDAARIKEIEAEIRAIDRRRETEHNRQKELYFCERDRWKKEHEQLLHRHGAEHTAVVERVHSLWEKGEFETAGKLQYTCQKRHREELAAHTERRPAFPKKHPPAPKKRRQLKYQLDKIKAAARGEAPSVSAVDALRLRRLGVGRMTDRRYAQYREILSSAELWEESPRVSELEQKILAKRRKA